MGISIPLMLTPQKRVFRPRFLSLNVNKSAIFCGFIEINHKTLTESFSVSCNAEDVTLLVTVIYKTSFLYHKFEEQ